VGWAARSTSQWGERLGGARDEPEYLLRCSPQEEGRASPQRWGGSRAPREDTWSRESGLAEHDSLRARRDWSGLGPHLNKRRPAGRDDDYMQSTRLERLAEPVAHGWMGVSE
jgi:hypothetical protein